MHNMTVEDLLEVPKSLESLRVTSHICNLSFFMRLLSRILFLENFVQASGRVWLYFLRTNILTNPHRARAMNSEESVFLYYSFVVLVESPPNILADYSYHVK